MVSASKIDHQAMKFVKIMFVTVKFSQYSPNVSIIPLMHVVSINLIILMFLFLFTIVVYMFINYFTFASIYDGCSY